MADLVKFGRRIGFNVLESAFKRRAHPGKRAVSAARFSNFITQSAFQARKKREQRQRDQRQRSKNDDPQGNWHGMAHNEMRSFAQPCWQGAPTQTVHLVRQGGATPPARLCETPSGKRSM